MLERKAYRRLLDWKRESRGGTAMLVEGARRVGKSTLVGEFARREYRSHLVIDFSTAPGDVVDLFENRRSDVRGFLALLSAYYDVEFFERDTLIVFDEVQFLPVARSFIKHLVADGRYDYIETGSLISIRQNVEGILIPSEEESMRLEPLDFEEFLWAVGSRPLADMLRETARTLRPLPDMLHRKAMELLRAYALVGGMPQAVVEYADSRDPRAPERVKRSILRLYRSDVVKFAGRDTAKVLSIFDDIPAQLSKHEKRFTLASLGDNARRRDYENAFFWLEDARITNTCYNATDPQVGLSLYRDRPTFKCYMADTGLLSSMVYADNRDASARFYRDVLFGRLEVNEGMVMENIVAQMLTAAGHRLYFYSRYDKADSQNTMEIDFLITREDPKARICPIEVKSTKRYATASLDKFKARFGKRIGRQIILHTGNIERGSELDRLPVYLAAFL